MHRRHFITSTLGATFMAATSNASSAQTQNSATRTPELYVWRQYVLRNGTQLGRLADYLQNAAIPALNRLGHSPIGVFEVTFGLPTPMVFVLTPSASLDSLASIETRLERDEAFIKAAAGYFNAPATDPVYLRQEVSLLTAFPNVPRVEVPAATAAKGPRLFELRTYESHNERAHRAKVRMFAEMGEVDIFRACGLTPVFLRAHARRLANTEPDIHARAREHGRPREELGQLPQQRGLEKTVVDARLRRRRDRVEHHDGFSPAGGLFAGLSD
jgi:hypothetical protein